MPKSNHNPPKQRTIPFPVTQAPINGAYPTIQDVTQGQNAATQAYCASQQIQLERPSHVVQVQAESAPSTPHSTPLDHPAPQAQTANPHAQLTQIHRGFHTIYWQPEAPQSHPGPNNGPSSPNHDLLEGVAPSLPGNCNGKGKAKAIDDSHTRHLHVSGYEGEADIYGDEDSEDDNDGNNDSRSEDDSNNNINGHAGAGTSQMPVDNDYGHAWDNWGPANVDDIQLTSDNGTILHDHGKCFYELVSIVLLYIVQKSMSNHLIKTNDVLKLFSINNLQAQSHPQMSLPSITNAMVQSIYHID